MDMAWKEAPRTRRDGQLACGRSWPRGRATFAVEMAPGGGLRMSRNQEKPRLSLCMIVRDSARTLPACLESIRPWVDEMVIVDTGSVDETPRIVESFGGRLFHFPWCDDFSAARNESLRHAGATGCSGWTRTIRSRRSAGAGCDDWLTRRCLPTWLDT